MAHHCIIATVTAAKKKLSTRDMSRITKALADPRRFGILKRIAQAPSIACSDLRDAFPVSAPTLSHHLKELETAGLIEAVKRGKYLDVTFQRDLWTAYVEELGRL